MMKRPVQVQDYEKDKEEDEGEVILTSLMGVPIRCKAISGMCHRLSIAVKAICAIDGTSFFFDGSHLCDLPILHLCPAPPPQVPASKE
jgi:hypothetical protein